MTARRVADSAIVSRGAWGKRVVVLDKDRWIPISALPLDLQLAAAESPDRLRTRRTNLDPERTRGLFYTGIVVLLIGLAYVLIDLSAAFASPWRLLSFSLGGLLVALHWAAIWGRGFRATQGQKVVLGDASLVLVDRQHARVLPAEGLKLVVRRVDYGAEVLDKDLVDDALRTRLQKLVAAVQDDPSLCERDRFRMTATEASPVSPFAVRLRAYEPAILGVALVASSVMLLETGPIHARAERRLADVASAKTLDQHGHDIAVGRDAFVAASLELAKAAALVKNRKPLLEKALGGTADDARAFLTTYGPKDEGSPLVQTRLHEVCQAKIPMGNYDPEEERALRGALRCICESTDGKTLSYVDHADATRFKVEYFLTQYFTTELSRAARPLMMFDLPRNLNLVAIEEKSATSPFVELQMKRTQTLYDITVIPLDAPEKPLPRAAYRRLRVPL